MWLKIWGAGCGVRGAGCGVPGLYMHATHHHSSCVGYAMQELAPIGEKYVQECQLGRLKDEGGSKPAGGDEEVLCVGSTPAVMIGSAAVPVPCYGL